MRPPIPPRYLNPLVLILTLALSSCGGGTNTAGAGGSGVGGTGITTVAGNVSQVVDQAPEEDQAWARKLFAGAVIWISTPVNAQSSQLGGIQVLGGGRMATTDDSGNFVLDDVVPSDNFVLRFVLEGNESIALPIGAVRAGSRVRVNNIVVNTGQGTATATDVEVVPDDASANSKKKSSEIANDASSNNNANGGGNSNAGSSGIENNAGNGANSND